MRQRYQFPCSSHQTMRRCHILYFRRHILLWMLISISTLVVRAVNIQGVFVNNDTLLYGTILFHWLSFAFVVAIKDRIGRQIIQRVEREYCVHVILRTGIDEEQFFVDNRFTADPTIQRWTAQYKEAKFFLVMIFISFAISLFLSRYL